MGVETNLMGNKMTLLKQPDFKTGKFKLELNNTQIPKQLSLLVWD
jgi:hypothetical protein